MCYCFWLFAVCCVLSVGVLFVVSCCLLWAGWNLLLSVVLWSLRCVAGRLGLLRGACCLLLFALFVVCAVIRVSACVVLAVCGCRLLSSVGVVCGCCCAMLLCVGVVRCLSWLVEVCCLMSVDVCSVLHVVCVVLLGVVVCCC